MGAEFLLLTDRWGRGQNLGKLEGICFTVEGKCIYGVHGWNIFGKQEGVVISVKGNYFFLNIKLVSKKEMAFN